MINHPRMQLIKKEEDINYYLFSPSVFSLYYDDCAKKHQLEPVHRYTLTHKLHMLQYIYRGGGI